MSISLTGFGMEGMYRQVHAGKEVVYNQKNRAIPGEGIYPSHQCPLLLPYDLKFLGECDAALE